MKRKLINVCEDLTVGGQILNIKDLEGKYLTDEEGGGLSLSECDWYYAKDDEATSGGVYEKLEPSDVMITKVDSFSTVAILMAVPKSYDPQGKSTEEVMKNSAFSGMYPETINFLFSVDGGKLGIHLELTKV